MREIIGRSAVQGALVLVLALVLPFAAPAANDGEVRNYIVSINRLYESLDYELALSRIQLARQLPRSTDDEVTLSLYEGLILCDMGKPGPGTSALRAALLLRPDVQLPVQVGPKQETLFESVRKQVKQEVAPLLPPSETARPSSKTEQKREDPPASADSDKRTMSPTPTEVSSPPEAQQESHANKDQTPTSTEQKREDPPASADSDKRTMSPPSTEDSSPPGAQQEDHANKAQTPTSTEQETLSGELLMRRRLRLQTRFLQGDSPSKRVPIRELDKIGQDIQAASTPESLQEAAHALDIWQQQHLRQ